MHRLAVLASGRGTNFEALALAERRGELGGRIVALVSDRMDAPALGRARRLGVEAVHLSPGRFKTRIEDETFWVDALRSRGVDLVLLAGFMRRLHRGFLAAFPDRILNIHPSLLPSFPGLDAIRQAWEGGVRVTGCTVHVVDEGLDAGPILSQSAVEVREDDTLASLETRIHEAEHRLYPWTVRRVLSEPWHREGMRVVFGGAPETAARARGGS
jgi:phosphoribosylglycinamide formyltransferase-1